jgi:uncharacterized protein (DUF302 family)
MIYITKIVEYSYEDALVRVTEALKKEGFGVITEIDVRKILKEEINEDFRKYKILGACNPRFAFQALSLDPMVGLLMPCNVIVQEHPDGKVEVTTFNPIANMPGVVNPKLEDLSKDMECKLTDAIKQL